jgi:hypothetical protein
MTMRGNGTADAETQHSKAVWFSQFFTMLSNRKSVDDGGCEGYLWNEMQDSVRCENDREYLREFNPKFLNGDLKGSICVRDSRFMKNDRLPDEHFEAGIALAPLGGVSLSCSRDSKQSDGYMIHGLIEPGDFGNWRRIWLICFRHIFSGHNWRTLVVARIRQSHRVWYWFRVSASREKNEY